jgi:hypothetical protein
MSWRLVVLVASMALASSARVEAFGVDYNLGLKEQGGLAFEEDVRIEAAEVETRLRSGLYYAWQAEMVDPTGKLPAIGGHFGFQILEGGAYDGYEPVLTFNFGWMSNAAVLLPGIKAFVRNPNAWSKPYWQDNTGRMKAEIEGNLAAAPHNPNLFLGYAGQQHGLPHTPWADGVYHVVDWKPNLWYHMRLARDREPKMVLAWVLHKNANGSYSFSNNLENISVHRWCVTLIPERRRENGAFEPNGEPIELVPFFLSAAYKLVRPLNCWGECIGRSPRYDVRWEHVNPRLINADEAVLRIPQAKVSFWGFDDLDYDAGPLGDSRSSHAFYLEYCGYRTSDEVTFSPTRRGMSEGAMLWNDLAPGTVSIEPQPKRITWNESAVTAYLNSLPGARYHADSVILEDEEWTVNRALTLRAGGSTRIEFAKLFGSGAAALRFEALTSNNKWLLKGASGFTIPGTANQGKPFHVEVEAYVPGTSNTVGWLDLRVSFDNGPTDNPPASKEAP